jgi:hypothetical protein
MDILAALADSGDSSSTGTGTGTGKRPVNAPAEFLDYAHVNRVDDTEELGWILATLRRGVHGRYPEVRESGVAASNVDVGVCVCEGQAFFLCVLPKEHFGR